MMCGSLLNQTGYVCLTACAKKKKKIKIGSTGQSANMKNYKLYKNNIAVGICKLRDNTHSHTCRCSHMRDGAVISSHNTIII